MASYKNIPVDEETYDMLQVLCEVHERKQGAQVKALVKVEYEKLEKSKQIPRGEPKKREAGKENQ